MDRPDQISAANLELLRYLIDKLQAQDNGDAALNGSFTFVTGSVAVGINNSKIVATASAGTITLTLPALTTLPNLWGIIAIAQGATNPIVVAPPSGTIWDPSASAFAATATLTNGGGGARGWWQLDKPNSRFIQIV